MKKLTQGTLALLLVLCVLCGCAGQRLPLTAFPAERSALDDALQSCGMSYRLVEVEGAPIPREQRLSFGLYEPDDPEDRFVVCAVATGLNDNETRYLYLSFAPFFLEQTTGLEDSEPFLTLAAQLYGGFKTADELYAVFTKELGVKNTETIELEDAGPNRPEQRLIWEKKIGDTYCQIVLDQPKADEPLRYMGTLGLSGDPSLFERK